jgi:hypothetical protein
MIQTEAAPVHTRATGTTIYASFSDASWADKAAGALLDFGVRAEDISLVKKEKDGEKFEDSRFDEGFAPDDLPFQPPFPPVSVPDSGEQRARVYLRSDEPPETAEAPDLPAKSGISTTTPADAASGAVTGAGIGLGIGALAAAASLAIPGFGLVIGGGALATAIAGAAAAAAAGAVAGGVTGYLKDQGVPEDSVEQYVEDYCAGGAILAVTAPSNDVDETTVEHIMAKYQGRHIGSFGGYPH